MDGPADTASPRLGIQTHIVLLVCGRWWVDIEGKGFGPCIDQRDACQMAVNLAEAFGDESRKREVVLMRPGKGHVQIWTSWKLVPDQLASERQELVA